jgi:ABC-type Na+ efflux pump permease subunit
MRTFWLVLRKELTCCWRDPDVLIYAFLFPLLLYPLMAVFVNEASIWYSSMQEKNREVVYVSGKSPLALAIASGLRRKNHFIVIDDATEVSPSKSKSDESHNQIHTSSVDQANLSSLKGRAVAVLNVDPITSQISIVAHEASSYLGTVAEELEKEIREARLKALTKELKAKGISADILSVFDVQKEGLKKLRSSGTTDSHLKQMFDKMIALLVLFTILMMTIIGGPASVCMMTEEHEKKTFHTTLLLPINRMKIVIAKFMAVTIICVGGAAFNLLCLAMFAVAITSISLGHVVNITKVLDDLQHLSINSASYYVGSGIIFVQRIKPYVQLPTLPELILIAVFFCSTGALLSAVYLCVAGCAKTVKSAQTLVSLPMLLLMALPAIALIPGIQFNLQTSFIPIANLLIMRKFENPPLLPSLIAIVEPLVLVVLILNLVRLIFESEVRGKRRKGPSVGRPI